jgi:thiamine-monophosphate kinase
VRDPFSESEDAFLGHVGRLFGRPRPRRGTVGIGDDAAVLPAGPRRIVTKDLLVEGRHFDFRFLSPADLAVRALEANLSDLAGTGARPEGIIVGLAWPTGDADRRRAGGFLDGLARACRARGVPVLGGDTTSAPAEAATISITAIGTPLPGGPVLRSGGRPGDVLLVTGGLGAAGLGLEVLAGRWSVGETAGEGRAAAAVRRAWRRPRARLDAAEVLAGRARALMDLSDGLGLDLPRLARASRCGFECDAPAIPVHPAVERLCRDDREAMHRWALSGGEDFELLAAVAPRALARLRRLAGERGVALHPIGRLLGPRAGQWLRGADGRRTRWDARGWDPWERTAGEEKEKSGSRLDGSAPGRVGGGERPGNRS